MENIKYYLSKSKGMNLKENKLLYELDYNARASLADLNKKTGISKQNLNHKIKSFEKQGIIEKYVSVIDIHKLGYLTYRAYLRLGKVSDKEMKEVGEYLKKNQQVLWLVSITGTWDFEIVFVAKNYIEFANLFESMRQHLGEKLAKFNLSLSIVNLHYTKDYLLDKKRKVGEIAYYGYEPENKKIDKLDTKILIELSENCRRSNQQIGEKLGVSHHTIRERIKRMEKEGIIQTHRTKIHIQKLGYRHMKAALHLYPHSKETEKELVEFISSFPNVTYVVKILGEWEIEIEAEVESDLKFAEILKDVRNKFSKVINDYYVFEVPREIKLNYFPIGELLLNKKV